MFFLSFPPPLFFHRILASCLSWLHMRVLAPMWVLSRTQAPHLASLHPNMWDHGCQRVAHPACHHLPFLPPTRVDITGRVFIPPTHLFFLYSGVAYPSPFCGQHNQPTWPALLGCCIHALPASPNGHYPLLRGTTWTWCLPSVCAPFGVTTHQALPQRCQEPLPSPQVHSPSVQSALARVSTPCQLFSAQPLTPGTISTTPTPKESTRLCVPEKGESRCVASGSGSVDATRSMTTCMCALVVAPSPTAPVTALELRKHSPPTLYRADAWEQELKQAGLIDCFPFIPAGFREGFIVGYPEIFHVQSPPNSTSLSLYNSEFDDIISKELAKGRYIRPFLAADLVHTIGPFQSSPLSLIPKPGRLGKFRLVQNLSFPATTYPVSPIHPLITL